MGSFIEFAYSPAHQGKPLFLPQDYIMEGAERTTRPGRVQAREN